MEGFIKTEAYISFKKKLTLLKEKSAEKRLSLKEIVPFFSGKGKIVLLIFLCIPFSQIFGLAIPFGCVIAYIGLAYAFFKEPWLPKFILKKKIPRKLLKFVVINFSFFSK